jgi:dTDP-4-amino-4,6-dideoxy-D-galactose acyltransferase
VIEELAWDTAFFGRKIGRISPPASAAELQETLAGAREEKFTYLTSRFAASEVPVAQILEQAGFYLIDFGLVFERNAEGLERPRQAARSAAVEDSVAVGKIAESLFRDGRFYHDPFFAAGEAERFYRVWAENLVKGAADKVFLIEGEGFVTCRTLGREGEIPLIGVSASHRGKGTGKALMLSALAWFRERNAGTVKVRTQAGNLPAVKFYERLGFRVSSADVTMGKILVPKRWGSLRSDNSERV